MDGPSMTVAVVIPYYRQPQQLALVLAALDLQTHPAELIDVVVADDGSPEPPELGRHASRVRLVRQADEGFRAAAARNLGAAHARGEVICFLDADTVPEPGYLAAMVAAVTADDALVVGRRRHADLTAWTPDRITAWFATGAPAPRELTEPQWLRDGYARTANLSEAGDDAYRFVISAVLAVPRALFDRVGGFEEAFRDYGGEDWEFARRCWLAGAPFAHAPAAVAWHDGPEFAERGADRRPAKNREALALARFVTDPATRGHGLVWGQPDVVVRLDDRDAPDEAVLLSVQSLLRDSDAAVWLRWGHAARPGGPLAQDPRVHVGEPPEQVLGRCRYQADVDRPVALVATTLREACDAAPAAGPGFQVLGTRAVNRAETGHPRRTEIPTEELKDVDLGRTLGRAARATGRVT